MNNRDKEKYIDRYSERLEKYGVNYKTLGWGKEGRQDLRFSIVNEYFKDGDSILDVGCGFGDLAKYLSTNDRKFQYTGIDLNLKLLDNAFKSNNVSYVEGDLLSYNFDKKFDYVVSNGIFNFKLEGEDNNQYIEQMVSKMFTLANKIVFADFMTSNVDFRNESGWYTDPADLIKFIPTLTRRFSIRNDYMPFEYAIVLFKDDEKTEMNTFKKI